MHAPAPHDMNPRVPHLDGLRGLAAGMVVVSHISNQSNLWDDMLGAGGGVMGVRLFFVLSGYLMGLLYLDRTFTKEELRRYVSHRVARVLPLFYAVVVAALVLRQIGYEAYEIDDAFSLLLLIDGSDVFWTIPIEIHFYVAFIGIWGIYARWPRAGLALMVASSVWLLLFGPPAPIRLFYWMQFFLAGLLVSRWRWDTKWIALTALSFPLLILLFPRIASTILFHGDPDALQKTDYDGWHSIACLFAVSGCLLATLNVSVIAAFFSLRPMRFLGRVSYSLYLLHMPIVIALWQVHMIRQPIVFLIIALASTIGIAALSYRLIEDPARRLINRTANRQHVLSTTQPSFPG